jgi:4-amino-4-deoxy-L-arabinose transferase-like glycosyltransferase
VVSSLHSKRLFLAVVAGLLLLASFLRLETYDQRPLWFDERETQKLSLEVQASGLLDLARGDQFEHPSLHPLIISWFIHWIDPVAAIRLPSVVFGVGSVALLIWLGALLFDRRVALVAGTLMTLSVYHINYSQDGRAYTLLLVSTLGQYISLLGFWKSKKLSYLIPFPILALCSVYAHHLGVLIQGSLVLTAIALAAVDISRGDPEQRPVVLRKMMVLALVWVVVGLAYLPQLLNTASWIDGVQRASPFTLRFSLRLFHDVFARWGSGGGWIAAGYALLFAIGAVAIWGRTKVGLILSIWLVVPFVTFALIPSRHFFDLRYVMMALPAFFLIVAKGITWLANALASAASRRNAPFSRESASTATLISLLAILAAFSASSYLQFRQTQYRCSEFPSLPQVLRMQDGFCGEYLLLNTLLERDRYLLETH